MSTPYATAPAWGTYTDPALGFGFGGQAQVDDMAVDAAGNVYLVGTTSKSSYLPATWGPFPVPPMGSSANGFLAVLDPSGSNLLFFTYLGGTGLEWEADLALLPGDKVAVAFSTTSTHMLLPTAPYPTNAGAEEIYMAVLEPLTAPTSIKETYFGEWDHEHDPQVAYNAQTGELVLTGFSSSPSLPTGIPGLSVDACQWGRMFVTTWDEPSWSHTGTSYVDFPTPPSFPCSMSSVAKSWSTHAGLEVTSGGHLFTSMSHAFTTDCNQSAPATSCTVALLLGPGAGILSGHLIGDGSVSDVALATSPSTPPGLQYGAVVGQTTGAVAYMSVVGPQGSVAGSSDAYIALFELPPVGSISPLGLAYGGGSDRDASLAVAGGNDGTFTMGGWTVSDDFPTNAALGYSYQPSSKCSGCQDGWYQTIDSNPPGVRLHSTYIGGTDDDAVRAVARDASTAYAAGVSESYDALLFGTPIGDGMPTTSGSYEPKGDSHQSGWAARLN